jgi:hypothetical protein
MNYIPYDGKQILVSDAQFIKWLACADTLERGTYARDLLYKELIGACDEILKQ